MVGLPNPSSDYVISVMPTGVEASPYKQETSRRSPKAFGFASLEVTMVIVVTPTEVETRPNGCSSGRVSPSNLEISRLRLTTPLEMTQLQGAPFQLR